MKDKKKILFTIFVVLFVCICIVEGVIYYGATEENLFVVWMLNLKNIPETFLLSSDIEISDAASLMTSENIWIRYLQYVYIIVLLVAPAFTAAAIITFIKHFYLQIKMYFKWRNKTKVSVIGDTKESLKITNRIAKTYHAVLFQHDAVDRDQRVHSLEEGIDTYSLSEDVQAVFESTKLEESKMIFILETEPIQNFVTFSNVISYFQQKNLQSHCTFIVLCENDAVMEMIEDFYSGCMKENEIIKQKTELVTLPLTKLEAMSMLEEKPLYTYQLKTYASNHTHANYYDQHIAIVGFEQLGSQFLLQALNKGVLSSQSNMIFDVFDENIEDKKGMFLQHFSSALTQDCQTTFCLPSSTNGSMDGKVEIRFHEINYNSYTFSNLVKQLHQQSPFTYMTICLKDNQKAIQSMIALEKVLTQEEKEYTPLVVSLEVSQEVSSYLSNNHQQYTNVYVPNVFLDTINIEDIYGYINDQYAMNFNLHYNQIDMKDASSWNLNTVFDYQQAIQAWKKMSLSKRQSSRALSFHQDVKLFRLAQYRYEKEQIDTDFETYFNQLMTQRKKGTLSLQKEFQFIYEQLESLSQYKDNIQFVKHVNANPMIQELGALEHRRWCQFEYTDGYRYKDSVKDEQNRTNPCLLSWQDLSEKLPEYCQYDFVSYIIL